MRILFKEIRYVQLSCSCSVDESTVPPIKNSETFEKMCIVCVYLGVFVCARGGGGRLLHLAL